MYGIGMALFYSIASFGSKPTTAIWLAYSMNLCGIIIPSYILIRDLFSNRKVTFSIISIIFCISTLLLEKSTFSVLQIHADTAAISFILIGLCFFKNYDFSRSYLSLFLTSFFLVLAVWAKLPTVLVLIFPILYLLIERRLKESFIFFSAISLTFLLVSTIFCILYGFSDLHFFVLEFPSGSMWSYRNDLFDGTNAILLRHSYFEGIPLLFRFFVMYLGEYWYFLITTVSLFFVSFKVPIRLKFLSRSISLFSLLTLPTCLAHLARFGAVENALIFTNLFAIIGFIILFVIILNIVFDKNYAFLVVGALTFLLLLPVVRTAKALPSTTNDSPHQQAFNYLKMGNRDVYFGWYPIAHLLYSGANYTSIEVPNWVGMNEPSRISFDISHIPEGAQYIATSKTGYGSLMLKQYLGELTEISSPIELSNWRLYEIELLKK